MSTNTGACNEQVGTAGSLGRLGEGQGERVTPEGGLEPVTAVGHGVLEDILWAHILQIRCFKGIPFGVWKDGIPYYLGNWVLRS